MAKIFTYTRPISHWKFSRTRTSWISVRSSRQSSSTSCRLSRAKRPSISPEHWTWSCNLINLHSSKTTSERLVYLWTGTCWSTAWISTSWAYCLMHSGMVLDYRQNSFSPTSTASNVWRQTTTSSCRTTRNYWNQIWGTALGSSLMTRALAQISESLQMTKDSIQTSLRPPWISSHLTMIPPRGLIKLSTGSTASSERKKRIKMSQETRRSKSPTNTSTSQH